MATKKKKKKRAKTVKSSPERIAQIEMALFGRETTFFDKVVLPPTSLSSFDVFSLKRAQRRTLLRPPGARLDAFASLIFPKRIYETVMKPCLAETQSEYFEALQAGKLKTAKWIHVRGIMIFWSTVGLQLPVSTIKLVRKIWTVSGG